MAFFVTENWSGRTISYVSRDGSTGRRVFCVTGIGVVANENNVLTASGIPKINDQYVDPAGTTVELLRCCNAVPETISPGYMRVTCSYAVGGQFAAPAANPLDQAPIYYVSTSEIEEEVDHDVDGNPIVNLVKNPLPGAKGTFHVDTWTITKNLATYPYSTNLTYRNTVNSEDITLDGVNVPAGYCRCVSILPTKAFGADDDFVQCQLTLAVYDTQQLANPWQHRILNQGSEAYAHLSTATDTSAKKGLIVLKNSGADTSRDVLLDLNGKPFDTGAYSTKQNHGEQLTDTFDTSPVAAGIVAAMTIAPDTSVTGCVYLIYRKCKTVSFSPLVSMFA